MAEELDSFDETVPHAADKSEMFLQVIQQRADEQDLGFNFRPERVRKTGQTLLKATLPKSGNMWTGKGLGMDLVVYADPVGSALQVGWQVVEEGMGSLAQSAPNTFGPAARMAWKQRDLHAARREKSQDAAYQRQLRGIVGAFQSLVFIPTVQDLVSAVEVSNRPRSGEGFLGAE